MLKKSFHQTNIFVEKPCIKAFILICMMIFSCMSYGDCSDGWMRIWAPGDYSSDNPDGPKYNTPYSGIDHDDFKGAYNVEIYGEHGHFSCSDSINTGTDRYSYQSLCTKIIQCTQQNNTCLPMADGKVPSGGTVTSDDKDSWQYQDALNSWGNHPEFGQIFYGQYNFDSGNIDCGFANWTAFIKIISTFNTKEYAIAFRVNNDLDSATWIRLPLNASSKNSDGSITPPHGTLILQRLYSGGMGINVKKSDLNVYTSKGPGTEPSGHVVVPNIQNNGNGDFDRVTFAVCKTSNGVINQTSCRPINGDIQMQYGITGYDGTDQSLHQYKSPMHVQLENNIEATPIDITSNIDLNQIMANPSPYPATNSTSTMLCADAKKYDPDNKLHSDQCFSDGNNYNERDQKTTVNIMCSAGTAANKNGESSPCIIT